MAVDGVDEADVQRKLFTLVHNIGKIYSIMGWLGLCINPLRTLFSNPNGILYKGETYQTTIFPEKQNIIV
jgi:hypothetical protein